MMVMVTTIGKGVDKKQLIAGFPHIALHCIAKPWTSSSLRFADVNGDDEEDDEDDVKGDDEEEDDDDDDDVHI